MSALNNISVFINSYYQYRDIQYLPKVKSVLEIGPGIGFTSLVLRSQGFSVTTLDNDPSRHPDILGDVSDLSSIRQGTYDVIIASHVLEHIPFTLFAQSIAEISRIGKYALIYLPIAGRHFQLGISSDFPRHVKFSIYFDLFNYFNRTVSAIPKWGDGHHYWELGMRGCSKRRVSRLLSSHFQIMHQYRNMYWNASYNFVLKSNGYVFS